MPDSAPTRPAAAPRATVRTEGDRRSLEFSPGQIQSVMLLSRPDYLVLDYARAMMCFALFQPRPRDIVMVGLGGGSLVKFCHRHLPHTRLTVLELRADVIALRAQFRIPPDDARLRVIHTDAAAYLARAPGCADVLLIDGFDAHGLPPALGSARFYADCRRALRPGGVLAANIFSYDPDYDGLLRRLGAAFGQRLCHFDGSAGNNHIWFALRADAAARGARAAHALRLARLWRKLGWPALNRPLARLLVWWLGRQGG